MDISARDVGGATECFIDCPLPLKMLLALLGSLNLTGLAMQDYVIAKLRLTADGASVERRGCCGGEVIHHTGGVNWLIKPWLVSRKWVCLISGEDWGAAGAGGGEARDEGRLSCAKRASRRGWEAWKELVPCFFRHFCLILSLRQENLYFTTSARLIFPELSSSKGLAQNHHLGMAVVENFFFFKRCKFIWRFLMQWKLSLSSFVTSWQAE